MASLAHSRLGADLSGIPAHCSSAETDYQSAVQELREFEFPLWATLLAHKDANLAEVMCWVCEYPNSLN